MKLLVKERLLLFDVLPKEGDFKTLKLLREFKESLSLTEDEHDKLQVNSIRGITTWNEPDPENPYTADIEIGDVIMKTITYSLENLNNTKKLPEAMFELYERFVMGIEVADPTDE